MGVEEQRDALLALLPPGLAFPRDPDAKLAALCAALGVEADRVEQAAAALLEEIDPRTCVQFFAERCASFGLPDPTFPPASTAELRAQLVARETGTGGQSIPYLIALAASLGYAITITEFRPPVCGEAECGDAESSTEDQIFVWTVNAAEFTEFPAECGDAECGDAACGGTATNALLEHELKRVKPSHTEIVFSYGA